MSRYSARQPFTTAAEFVAARPFVLNGHPYAPGEALSKDGVGDRVLRNLYDQRKIEIAPTNSPAKPAQAARKADAAPAAPKPAPEAKKPASAPPVAADAPADAAPRYRVKHAGLGGYKVIDANGAPVGKGYPTKAEAEAEIARLTAS